KRKIGGGAGDIQLPGEGDGFACVFRFGGRKFVEATGDAVCDSLQDLLAGGKWSAAPVWGGISGRQYGCLNVVGIPGGYLRIHFSGGRSDDVQCPAAGR